MELFGLDILEIVIRLGLGLVIGFCIGLTGVGGGVLMLPALTLLLKMNSIMAVGTASLYSFLTKFSATFHHVKLKTIDWTLSLLFLAGALPANAVVSFWVTRRGSSAEFQHGLRIFITGTVFFCIGTMVLNLASHIRNQRNRTQGHKLADRIKARPVLCRTLGVLTGAGIGALIGATSIGGGVLIIPLLMVLFGLEARRAVGSSIFIAVTLTLLTSLIYSKAGDTDMVTAVVMAAGSLIGVPSGSRLSVRMPDKWLQVFMIIPISVAAIMMLFGDGGH